MVRVANGQYPGIAADSKLWLKVRIDDKEGWIHSEDDFHALGLPEDEQSKSKAQQPKRTRKAFAFSQP